MGQPEHAPVISPEVNAPTPLTRTRFNLSLRGAQRRGNLHEAEHTSTNRRYYGDEIANPRIEYGVTMTKWVRVSRLLAARSAGLGNRFVTPV